MGFLSNKKISESAKERIDPLFGKVDSVIMTAFDIRIREFSTKDALAMIINDSEMIEKYFSEPKNVSGNLAIKYYKEFKNIDLNEVGAIENNAEYMLGHMLVRRYEEKYSNVIDNMLEEMDKGLLKVVNYNSESNFYLVQIETKSWNIEELCNKFKYTYETSFSDSIKIANSFKEVGEYLEEETGVSRYRYTDLSNFIRKMRNYTINKEMGLS